MQQMTDLLAVHTRHIDGFLADAAVAGVRQVVILASGLDARGYRLSWPPGTKVFEIDQPQVLEFKAATLAEVGAAPTVDLRTVPIDLRDGWPAALSAAGSTPPNPRLGSPRVCSRSSHRKRRIICWTTSRAQRRWKSADRRNLLEFPGVATGHGSRHQKVYEHGLDVKLDNLGYLGERSEIATYLDGHGWRTARILASQLLTDSGLPPLPSSDGETVFANNYYCTAVLRAG
jgi:O-methyltransferase involved in polyketide biosynthesis